MVKKDEAIFVVRNDERIELKGAEKEAYLEDLAIRQKEAEDFQKQLEELKLTKISAYKKLGLTDEEIAAII